MIFLLPYLIIFFGSLFIGKVAYKYSGDDLLVYVGTMTALCGTLSVLSVLVLY